MGMAMAPATDSVMGSLPLEKASVGSAVNDTTRTTGGALGVAVLGSLLASQYRGDMDDAVSGLPHDAAADLASDTLGGGLAVAHRLGDTGARRRRPARRSSTACTSRRWPPPRVALLGAVVAVVVIPAASARAAPGDRAAPEPVPA